MPRARRSALAGLCCVLAVSTACESDAERLPDPEPPADTVAPGAPPALDAAGFVDRIVLGWGAAADDRGVAGYRVVRGGTVLGETAGRTWTDAGLSANAAHCYEVRALDAAGNASDPSTACAHTGIDLTNESWVYPSHVAWDGQLLWVANYKMGTPTDQAIHAYDPATGALARTLPAPSEWTTSPCFAGGSLWVVDYLEGLKAFRLDQATGAVLQTVPLAESLAGEPRGLAWDGSSLYYARVHPGITSPPMVPSTIVELDLATGAAARVVYTTSAHEIDGLTFAEGSLWFLSHEATVVPPDRVVRISAADGTEEGSFALPSGETWSYGLGGLAIVGPDAWYVRRTEDAYALARTRW